MADTFQASKQLSKACENVTIKWWMSGNHPGHWSNMTSQTPPAWLRHLLVKPSPSWLSWCESPWCIAVGGIYILCLLPGPFRVTNLSVLLFATGYWISCYCCSCGTCSAFLWGAHNFKHCSYPRLFPDSLFGYLSAKKNKVFPTLELTLTITHD